MGQCVDYEEYTEKYLEKPHAQQEESNSFDYRWIIIVSVGFAFGLFITIGFFANRSRKQSQETHEDLLLDAFYQQDAHAEI